ncbi:16S rRNA (guanine(527)-N(7))-methyltransferase RsmG [Desulfotalea psychrophila]|uniref:Ribosomal RNA small subunit methyltransferase G n=1 Tax=Desulfotalea psychrophila (strain LSv54 / DSM 12343) TaxID=177439 RepID=RSMG_DESPS|nr:16S rRNA (guanine(527)-N(7))-methyltransferase RsmG [Desulfotalea psychrophila]Q6ANR2.1 RecName: Full=Ribosomal RNA small subunit methyltransferase G; AltName: Full=16S rRNA 7-methylguanosine methyltransferase; Short=16S rRNA m7G methyltransferase [Desulfotalea psychrophila LSv54]CAG36012.1 related to glucose inhibited division protein B [Desulfotalea psychrophila LSv54]
MSFDFYNELSRGCQAMGIELDRPGQERLYTYFVELKKWSQKVNLIAKGTGEAEIVENHFLDSLALLPLLPEGAGLLDIGTGAGLPGLICKAARPDLRLFLVEPRAKRVSFLRHIVRTLQLEGVEIYCSRIEDEPELFASEDISYITSRAVSDISGFLAMTEGFKSPHIRRLCLKGPRWQEELAEADEVLAAGNYQREKVVEYLLPFSGAERAIVVLR